VRVAIGVLFAASSAAVAVAGPVEGASAAPRCFGEGATIVGTAASDEIVGTNGPDVIAAGDGPDIVDGRGGADLICGGRGDDEIRAGAGADRVAGGRGGARIYGGSGPDVLRGVAEFWPGPGDDRVVATFEAHTTGVLHYESAGRSMHVDLGTGFAVGQGKDLLTGIRSVVGSRYPDFIAGDDAQYGGVGNILEGNGGADVLVGRGGDDVLFDGLAGTAGCDPTHTDEADVLRGGGGADNLHFGDGDDRAIGGGRYDGFFPEGSGHDVVRGGAGPDYIDFYCVGPVQVSLLTGHGTTAQGTLTISSVRDLNGSIFGDTLVGDAGKNSIGGGQGNDTIDGRGDDDSLGGAEGDDLLDGGTGTDAADGWTGTDTCISIEVPQNCEL